MKKGSLLLIMFALFVGFAGCKAKEITNKYQLTEEQLAAKEIVSISIDKDKNIKGHIPENTDAIITGDTITFHFPLDATLTDVKFDYKINGKNLVYCYDKKIKETNETEEIRRQVIPNKTPMNFEYQNVRFKVFSYKGESKTYKLKIVYDQADSNEILKLTFLKKNHKGLFFQDFDATIDEENKVVQIDLPYGYQTYTTNYPKSENKFTTGEPQKLIANFQVSCKAKLKVVGKDYGDEEAVEKSGVSQNDYSVALDAGTGLKFMVTAFDGTEQEYTVKVRIKEADATVAFVEENGFYFDLPEFDRQRHVFVNNTGAPLEHQFGSEAHPNLKTVPAKTVSVMVPKVTDLTRMRPIFKLAGVNATLKEKDTNKKIISDTTDVNFQNTRNFVIMAENETTTQDYQIVVWKSDLDNRKTIKNVKLQQKEGANLGDTIEAVQGHFTRTFDIPYAAYDQSQSTLKASLTFDDTEAPDAKFIFGATVADDGSSFTGGTEIAKNDLIEFEVGNGLKSSTKVLIVEAENGSFRAYTLIVNLGEASAACNFETFEISHKQGRSYQSNLNSSDYLVHVPFNSLADATKVPVYFEISKYASVSVQGRAVHPGELFDFSNGNTVDFKVTAQNGTTCTTHNVSVIEDPATGHDIISLQLLDPTTGHVIPDVNYTYSGNLIEMKIPYSALGNRDKEQFLKNKRPLKFTLSENAIMKLQGSDHIIISESTASANTLNFYGLNGEGVDVLVYANNGNPVPPGNQEKSKKYTIKLDLAPASKKCNLTQLKIVAPECVFSKDEAASSFKYPKKLAYNQELTTKEYEAIVSPFASISVNGNITEDDDGDGCIRFNAPTSGFSVRVQAQNGRNSKDYTVSSLDKYAYQWVVMVYANADNSREATIEAAFNKLFAANNLKSKGFKFVGLLDKADNGDSKIYEVDAAGKTEVALVDFGYAAGVSELDMGNPQTLKTFVEECKKEDSQKFMLLVLDRGYENKDLENLCQKHNAWDYISLDVTDSNSKFEVTDISNGVVKLENAGTASEKVVSTPLDLIFIDSDLMGTVETAINLHRKGANSSFQNYRSTIFFMGTPNLLGDNAIDYSNVITHLDGSLLDEKSLSKLIIDHGVNTSKDYLYSLSDIENVYMSMLKFNFSYVVGYQEGNPIGLVTATGSDFEKNPTGLAAHAEELTSLMDAYRYDNKALIDLKSYANKLATLSSPATAYNGLQAALADDAEKKVISYVGASSKYNGLAGLAMYFPMGKNELTSAYKSADDCVNGCLSFFKYYLKNLDPSQDIDAVETVSAGSWYGNDYSFSALANKNEAGIALTKDVVVTAKIITENDIDWYYIDSIDATATRLEITLPNSVHGELYGYDGTILTKIDSLDYDCATKYDHYLIKVKADTTVDSYQIKYAVTLPAPPVPGPDAGE